MIEAVNSQTHNMDYSNKNRNELIFMCKERGIRGYSGKPKAKLIELLESNNNNISKTKTGDVQHKDIKRPNVGTTVLSTNSHITEDTYTKELLKEQYSLHKLYVKGRIDTTKKIGVNVRLPSIPEDISENIIKQIIHNKLNDRSSTWNCKNGDLYSRMEGKQECKCFTSNGPISFTPSSDWNVLYFLDARKWLNNKFILYRIKLTRTSNEWKNIKVSKAQTFEDQTKQGRRPRITWDSLYPQIKSYCNNVYEGIFEDIFIPLEAKE